jgi:hypothetical protein
VKSIRLYITAVVLLIAIIRLMKPGNDSLFNKPFQDSPQNSIIGFYKLTSNTYVEFDKEGHSNWIVFINGQIDTVKKEYRLRGENLYIKHDKAAMLAEARKSQSQGNPLGALAVKQVEQMPEVDTYKLDLVAPTGFHASGIDESRRKKLSLNRLKQLPKNLTGDSLDYTLFSGNNKFIGLQTIQGADNIIIHGANKDRMGGTNRALIKLNNTGHIIDKHQFEKNKYDGSQGIFPYTATSFWMTEKDENNKLGISIWDSKFNRIKSKAFENIQAQDSLSIQNVNGKFFLNTLSQNKDSLKIYQVDDSLNLTEVFSLSSQEIGYPVFAHTKIFPFQHTLLILAGCKKDYKEETYPQYAFLSLDVKKKKLLATHKFTSKFMTLFYAPAIQSDQGLLVLLNEYAKPHNLSSTTTKLLRFDTSGKLIHEKNVKQWMRESPQYAFKKNNTSYFFSSRISTTSSDMQHKIYVLRNDSLFEAHFISPPKYLTKIKSFQKIIPLEKSLLFLTQQNWGEWRLFTRPKKAFHFNSEDYLEMKTIK